MQEIETLCIRTGISSGTHNTAPRPVITDTHNHEACRNVKRVHTLTVCQVLQNMRKNDIWNLGCQQCLQGKRNENSAKRLSKISLSLRSAPFWDFTQRRMVVSYRRFGKTYR